MNVHVSERIPWRNGEGGRKVEGGEHSGRGQLEAFSVHLPNCSPSPRLLLLGDFFWVVFFPPSTDPATELAETLLEAAIEDERPQPTLVPRPSGSCVSVCYRTRKGWERAR